MQLEEGNLAAAVLEYRNAVERDPQFSPARLKLADIYMRQGNGPAALEELVRAADLLPNDAGTQVKAGSLLLLARRFQDARARAEKALLVEPGRVDAQVLRANALAGLSDLEGALQQMQQAISLDPRSSLQSNLGAIQAAKGNLTEAEAAFRQAVATDPRSADAQIALGQFLWSIGKPSDAEAAFKAALGLDTESGLANRLLAALYLRTNRAVEAEPFLKRAVAVAGTADSKLGLADYYVAMKRPADAIAVLEAFGAEPRFWALSRARVADILQASGRPVDALQAVDEVILKHPTHTQARVVRGRLRLAQGRIDEAMQDAQDALKADAQNAEVHFLVGTIHEARRDLDAAATSYGEVLRLNPHASIAQVRLAMVEMQRNSLPTATQLAEQAVAAQPGNMAARLVLARSLLARGDVERAAAVTESLAAAAPEEAVVQNQVGLLALVRGDRTAGRAALEKALALDTRLIEPLAALVALDIEAKAPRLARARVEQRLRETPNDSAVLALAGRTWAATGDPAKGAELLRRAIDADAANLEAYTALARVFLQERRLDEAVIEFDRLVARQPRAVGPQTMAALILQAQGKEAEARQRFERLVELDPRAAVASNNLAWIYASRGEQLDKALQLAQAAKAQIPEHPEVNDTLAFVYLQKKLPSLAIQPLRLAVEKEPGNPSFHYHLGLAYSQLGDKPAARQALIQALKLSTAFNGAEDARKLLATLN